MKTLLNAATAAMVLVAGAGLAHASTGHAVSGHVVSGKLVRVNASRHMLTLGHHIYRYAPSQVQASLAPGQNVRVFYREAHGHRWVNRIVPLAG